MTVIQQRFFYGTVLLSSVLGLLWLDHHFEFRYGFLALILLFAAVGWVEMRAMAGDKTGLWVGGLALVAAIIGEWALLEGYDLCGISRVGMHLAAISVLPLYLLLQCFRFEPSRERLSEAAIGALSYSFLLIPLWSVFWLRLGLEDGEKWVLLTVLLVKGNDIGAFLTGRQIGRTPLCKISPKKTVEGSVGGLLLGAVVVFSFAHWAALPGLSNLQGFESVWKPAVLALVAGAAGQFGDLTESYFKRAFGVKDSGSLVPAYGGALDMLDSILFGAPAVFAMAVLFSR